MAGVWRRAGFIAGLWILGIAALAGMPGRASAEERLALIVGNAAYAGSARLENPVRDARAMADVLRDAKFRVTAVEDATGAALARAVEAFGQSVAAAGPDAVALVYYAGHAAQIEGLNYLLPVDVPTESEAALKGASVGVEAILKRLDATGARTRFVILDACRNNPFLASAAGPRGLTVDGPLGQARGEGGLTRLETGIGTLVAFATAPGRIAADGASGHSPYTAALLATIREPGLPIEALFRRARLAVHAVTGGEQIPWESSSLTGGFTFFPGPAVAEAGPAPAEAGGGLTPAARAVLAAGPTRERLRGLGPDAAHGLAVYLGTPEILRLYVTAFPTDPRALRLYALLDGITQETAWVWAVREDTRAALVAFRTLYPAGPHEDEVAHLLQAAPEARPVLAALCTPAMPAAPPVGPVLPAPRKVEPASPRRAEPAAPLRRAETGPAAAKPATQPVRLLARPAPPAPEVVEVRPRLRPAVQARPLPREEAPRPVRRPGAVEASEVDRSPRRPRPEPAVTRPVREREPVREVARPPRPVVRPVVDEDDDDRPVMPMPIPSLGFGRPALGGYGPGPRRPGGGLGIGRPPFGYGTRGGGPGLGMGRMF